MRPSLTIRFMVNTPTRTVVHALREKLMASAIALVASTVPLPAQSPPPAPVLADTAALIIHNRTVAVFRAPIGAVQPAERALAAARRIDVFAERQTSDSVTTRSIPQGVLILIGDVGVFTLTPADADTLADQTLAAAAAIAAARLRDALAAEREERSLGHLLWAGGLAAAATIAFLIAIRLIRWLRQRVLVLLPERAQRRLPELAISGFTVLSANSALTVLRRLADLAFWAAGLFAAYVWLAYVLTRFPYTRPWGEALGTYLGATTRNLALSAAAAIPGLFIVVLIVIATRWLGRLIGGFFDAVEGGSVDVPWVHPETANPTKRIVVALLWLFAIVLSYPYLPGSGSDVFKGVSLFAGVVLSLGSSGVVSQGMSGLVLMYSRALKPGDYVRIGDTEGTVTMLGMLSTKICTTKQEEVTIPNAVVVGANVKNYSRLSASEGVIVHTAVTIGYDVPWRQVEGLLLLAASRTAGLRATPAPFVLKTALSDFYVEYQLNARLDVPSSRSRVLSELHEQIVDAFNEFGVQILSPHYEADPPTPAVVPRDRWFTAPARPPAPPSASA